MRLTLRQLRRLISESFDYHEHDRIVNKIRRGGMDPLDGGLYDWVAAGNEPSTYGIQPHDRSFKAGDIVWMTSEGPDGRETLYRLKVRKIDDEYVYASFFDENIDDFEAEIGVEVLPDYLRHETPNDPHVESVYNLFPSH